MARLRRLGSLLAMVALVIAPAVRLACLAWCTGPATTGTAVATARADVATPSTGDGASHAHHHGPAAVAEPASAPPDAMNAAPSEARCDADRGRPCTEATGVLARTAGRADQTAAVLAPPTPVGPAVSHAPMRVAVAHVRIPPPGPPPVSMPLRI